MKALEAIANRAIVRERPAQPAFVHIRHTAAVRLTFDRFLGLTLRADEEYEAPLARHLRKVAVGPQQAADGLARERAHPAEEALHSTSDESELRFGHDLDGRDSVVKIHLPPLQGLLENRLILYSVLLIIMMLTRPQGLFGDLAGARRRVKSASHGHS